MATPNGDGSITLTTKVVTTGIKKGMAVIKKSVKTATVALTAFGGAVGYLVKQSVAAFADYEQLVGGVETLFKDSSDKVKEYANQAYKTAGLSANEYMRNVTSFSASLLNSLGGDTDRAADVANEAIIAISDNVNKMGSDYESVQNAFQGFAKQQYQLLDNLKLGYGGTKTEMERLLKDAEAYRASLGETVEYDINNLADVYTAIGDIQQKLGIAGTTALEAEKTISGSAATMKAAWENVLTAISGGGDLDRAIEELVESIEIYFENILPVVERALLGIGDVISKVAPRLVQTVAQAFIKALPQLISAFGDMLMGLFEGLKGALTELLSSKTNEVMEDVADKTKDATQSQEDLTDAIKDTNEEVGKTLAGFDEIQILSTSATEEENPLAKIVEGSGRGTNTGGANEINRQLDDSFAEMMGTVSNYLIVLGAILLLTGNLGWGLGLIIAGCIGSEYEEATIGDGSSIEELLGKLGGVLSIVGVVAIVLGVLLCFAQVWGFGIKLILVGATSLVSAVALNWDAIVEALQGPIGAITAIVGGALLVLGVILVCTGVGIPIGIALIAAGAASLVTIVALNWDAIVEWVRNAWEAVKAFWNTYIGFIFTRQWWSDLLAGVGDWWTGIVDWFENAWENIKSFWNQYIAPIFTAEWWLNLGKTCINGLITGFESGINWIIGAFEDMMNWIVDGLNKLQITLPEWLGGATWGINLQRASFGRVSIPRLAQGAVIPPNKEFLAVLGDQRQGTNIETPLETMVQAFQMALDSRGNRGSGEIIIEIDGREFGRAVIEYGDEEKRRIGARLVRT